MLDWTEIDWECPYCGSTDLACEWEFIKKDVAVLTCGDCGCYYKVYNEEIEYKVETKQFMGLPCQQGYEQPSMADLRADYEDYEYHRKKEEESLRRFYGTEE